MGARLLLRILAARARLLCLPPENLVGRVVIAAAKLVGATWRDHSKEIMTDLNIMEVFQCGRR